MDWEDIHDPKHEFVFNLNWSAISNSYTPEVIQNIINEKGVMDMVHIVDEHFAMTKGFKPLRLINQDGQKMVIENDYPVNNKDINV